MTETQLQLQNALTTTFLANLAFLSEYDNKLYHRVDELSRMIENGNYEEKYALEFIMESGDFDIYDIVNDKYLYNKRPQKINADLVKSSEFDQRNSIFSLENIFTLRNLDYLDSEIRFNIENLCDSNKLTQNDIFAYTNILKDFLNDKKKRLKEINKFIFFGTLLGRHIPKITNKINANLYLVLERNLEIFRLSLFTVDYTILTKKAGVIFSIMDDIIEEEQKIFNFLSINPLENYLIKFSTTGINIEEYIDRVLSSFMSIKPTSYDYNRYLYTYISRTTKVLVSNYKTLLINKMKNELNIFSDTPILFLAAGPSLDENIEWIKKNQNNFFIATIGAAYKKLLFHDIKIDMIFTLDEQFDVLNELQFDDTSVSLIDKNTIIIASVITDNRILKKFNQENLFLYEVFCPFYKDNIALSGFSVGELSIALLLNMNFKEIYLIGLDLALNQLTGSSHFGSSSSGIVEYDLKDTEVNRNSFGLRNSTIKVKGNFQDEVYTTALFYTSIKYLEKFLDTKEFDVNVYNLSSHGAYFENSIPKKISEIEVNNYKNINLSTDELVSIFKRYSAICLDNESKLEIDIEIKFIKNILLKEFIIYKENKSENYQEFFNSVIKVISLITDREFSNSSISHILRNYLQMIIPYLSFHFNDLKIKNENKKIKNVKKIFTQQIEQLIKDYLEYLQRVKE